MSKRNRARRKEKEISKKRRQAKTFRRREVSHRQHPLASKNATGFDDEEPYIETLERQYRCSPRDLSFLLELVEEHQSSGNFARASYFAELLVDAQPNCPEWRLVLSEAYVGCQAINAAWREARLALTRWPEHELVVEYKPTAMRLEAASGIAVNELGFHGADALENLTLHDRVRVYLSATEFERAATLAEELVSRCPRFVPAWNNLALAYFYAGRTSDANRTLRQSLEIDPTNIFALSSLVRVSVLEGKESEAWQWFERISVAGAAKSDLLVNFAQAAAWLGADERVVEARIRFDEIASSSNSPHCGAMYHLGAVAEYRLGREKKALELWNKAKSLRGGDLAELNLAAWKTSKEEFSPWYFAFRDWFPGQMNATWLVDWQKISEEEKEDEAVVNRWLSTHPSFIVLLPAMLDRGDESVRRLAIAIVLGSKRQEFVEPLRRFALGKKGTTDERFRVVRHLISMGVLPAGEPIRLFVAGDWRDMLLGGWEISNQPVATEPRSEEVQRLALKGYECLERRDAKRAEEFYRQAVKLHPDAPDLWNNLAEALDHLGRADEASEIASMLRQRYPDYFFGVIRDAKQAIDDQNFERAKTLLGGLLARKKLHLSEFRALATAHIHLGRKIADLQLAERWLDLWKRVEDHPWQLEIERSIQSQGLFSGLFKRLKRR